MNDSFDKKDLKTIIYFDDITTILFVGEGLERSVSPERAMISSFVKED
jgi:hypothetical protein